MAQRKAKLDFSSLFDRAAAACAESQRLVSQSANTVESARASRVASARLRRTAMQMRDAWKNAEAMHAILRAEVEEIARSLRDAGVDDRAAVATVRARIRFVLYDGGLTEQDTEPVVQRASLWVSQVYDAA
jgi:hypothetical protein